VLLVAASSISFITYSLVEKTGQEIGKRIINKFNGSSGKFVDN
jgi:hypothetical protein